MSIPTKLLEHVKAQRREAMLRTTVPILEGLLASGHYTHQVEGNGDSGVIRCDWGKDWKKGGHRSRVIALAIEDAMDMADDLINEIEWNVCRYDADHPLNAKSDSQ